MQNLPFVQVCQLNKCVDVGQEKLTILSNIDFSLEQGATLAIVGASGSGKSTLLSLLAGLDIPTSGEVCLGSHRLSTLSEEQRATFRLNMIGFVFQSFLLLPKLTVLENVMLPHELQGKADARENAQMQLEQVGLAHRMHYFPGQLSGGEQQRVAIARAFVANPTLLLADEPTGNLDQTTGHKIADLLFSLNAKQGTTLIIVTHDLGIAQRCHQQLTLVNGTIEEAEQ